MRMDDDCYEKEETKNDVKVQDIYKTNDENKPAQASGDANEETPN